MLGNHNTTKLNVYSLFDEKIFEFLGDKESGKTTLIAKLQGNEDPKKGAGLEYGYIDVRDEYRDGNIVFDYLAVALPSILSILSTQIIDFIDVLVAIFLYS